MTTAKKEKLMENYRFTTMLIQRHVAGISNAESVLQLPFEANCLNWIVGHILSRRNSVLEALGLEPVWDEQVLARYCTGSPPIRSEKEARPLSLLLSDLQTTQRMIDSALENASEADMEKVVENDRGTKTVWEHLESFHWHETYHLGQLDILGSFIVSQRIA